MKNITFGILALLAITLFNCDNDDDCDYESSSCENEYAANYMTTIFSIADGYENFAEWMDLEVHEYDIQINQSGEICSIGYQNPSTYTGSYTVAVINNTSGLSYSGLHTFSQAGLDYQNITAVTVTSGDIITVRRIITPGYTPYDAVVGRVLRQSDFSDVPYPLASNQVVFLSSKFSESTTVINNNSQPYIAFGFKAN
ncbi:hypothetical protein [Olleya sp. HaHaR_3_96]|uniref:hypothetical protein n=1 Tax=Olleya sp. HaHaR_3_96 TaxID=2745560 RepID=UPI001C4F915A|nr:hypothetical protein [Olleya sp. HaHaR_3_96]QXP61533.1 hypothetical protein H0I26_07865 [Olleya sp. HaHaR_3_96]